MPLVRRVVAGLHAEKLNSCMDFEDLVSAGTVGLIEAVDRFDAAQGTAFSTFAVPRIRGAVIDALRSVDHLSRGQRHLARTLEQAETELRAGLQREPKPAELAAFAGFTESQYREAELARDTSIESLSGSGSGDEAPRERPEPRDPSPALEERVAQGDLFEQLVRAVRALPERDRQLIGLRYNEELSMADIARILAISESRVCQLIARAHGRLRTHLQQRAAA